MTTKKSVSIIPFVGIGFCVFFLFAGLFIIPQSSNNPTNPPWPPWISKVLVFNGVAIASIMVLYYKHLISKKSLIMIYAAQLCALVGFAYYIDITDTRHKTRLQEERVKASAFYGEVSSRLYSWQSPIAATILNDTNTINARLTEEKLEKCSGRKFLIVKKRDNTGEVEDDFGGLPLNMTVNLRRSDIEYLRTQGATADSILSSTRSDMLCVAVVQYFGHTAQYNRPQVDSSVRSYTSYRAEVSIYTWPEKTLVSKQWHYDGGPPASLSSNSILPSYGDKTGIHSAIGSFIMRAFKGKGQTEANATSANQAL